jgi:hypothetical protein
MKKPSIIRVVRAHVTRISLCSVLLFALFAFLGEKRTRRLHAQRFPHLRQARFLDAQHGRREKLPETGTNIARLHNIPLGADSTIKGTGPMCCLYVCRCPRLADFLVEHWKNLTRLHMRRLARTTSRDTASVLEQLGVLSPQDYCYCKLHFDGSKVTVVDNLDRHCNGPFTARSVLIRLATFLR